MAKHSFTVTSTRNGKTIKHQATTIVPSGGIAKGKDHKYRTLAAECKGRYLSGNRFSVKGSAAKLETAIKHWDAYMSRKEGLVTGDSMNKGHSDRFKEFLKNEPSLLTGKKLSDSTVRDILCGFRKITIMYDKGYLMKEAYSVMGLKVAHSDKENPIKFTPGYKDRRDAYQAQLEGHRTKWIPVAAQLGRAFGLREAERIASRDVIVYRDGKYFATHKLGRMEEVSIKTLQKRYGDTIDRRLDSLHQNPGLKHLIVEEAKGERNRFMPINTETREAAVKRTHTFIRSQHDNRTYMKIHPDRQTPEKAENVYSKMQTRYGATIESQLNAHSDRHAEAQRLWNEALEAGMSRKAAAKLVTEEMGHDCPRKIRYYVDLKSE